MSFVASTDKTHEVTNVVETGLPGIKRALRTAVVYGANASGKTNLLLGLQHMRNIVMDSARLQPDQSYVSQQFKLDDVSRSRPTLFEVIALIDGIRYQYGFTYSSARIESEWLLVFQSHKAQTWLDREYRDGKDIIETPSSFLPGPKNAWKEATREKSLFLSVAVQLNSAKLLPLYNWFKNDVVVFENGGHVGHDYSTRYIESPEGQQSVADFLSSADIAIRSVTAVKQKGLVSSFEFDVATGEQKAAHTQTDILLPRFRHTYGDIAADFELTEESQGTQKLFALSGPLFDILQRGQLLVIDELDRSLHPLLVRQIVCTFQDPELNSSNAQLLFSTHDTSLLDTELFRRDQIWLTEKNADQTSSLVSLVTFSPRKNEALERGYLSGRYGAIPVLPGRLKTPRKTRQT
ncbi:ATP-binding protein [uncultured Rhodoblastus sp.]|uniref:AAA family ATPase n=1 Tax=uncultured Rhodoblastus sp. TaxID=543037 RepID=UPI0025FA0DA4|nr:ATP-binding protein [uncultured Rhodoblastus sp.]